MKVKMAVASIFSTDSTQDAPRLHREINIPHDWKGDSTLGLDIPKRDYNSRRQTSGCPLTSAPANNFSWTFAVVEKRQVFKFAEYM